jgi:hypothetical protein
MPVKFMLEAAGAGDVLVTTSHQRWGDPVGEP